MREGEGGTEGGGRLWSRGEYVCSQLEFNKVFVCCWVALKNLYALSNTHTHTLSNRTLHITVDMHAIHIITVVENNVTLDLRSSCGAMK